MTHDANSLNELAKSVKNPTALLMDSKSLAEFTKSLTPRERVPSNVKTAKLETFSTDNGDLEVLEVVTEKVFVRII